MSIRGEKVKKANPGPTAAAERDKQREVKNIEPISKTYIKEMSDKDNLGITISVDITECANPDTTAIVHEFAQTCHNFYLYLAEQLLVETNYEFENPEIAETLKHFKSYGVEEGNTVGFSFITNNEHIQKTLFDDFMLTTTRKNDRKKFRIIIDYDPDFRIVLVKQIIKKAQTH